MHAAVCRVWCCVRVRTSAVCSSRHICIPHALSASASDVQQQGRVDCARAGLMGVLVAAAASARGFGDLCWNGGESSPPLEPPLLLSVAHDTAQRLAACLGHCSQTSHLRASRRQQRRSALSLSRSLSLSLCRNGRRKGAKGGAMTCPEIPRTIPPADMYEIRVGSEILKDDDGWI